jgi:hypothetical protein
MLLLSLALAASASTQTPPSPVSPNTIVVTGRRIADYRAALEACLARNCPPNEDIDATMALAEALFVEGEYHGARTAILRSLGRNHDEARNYPEPVSDLYRANTRVARHLGLDRQARYSAIEVLQALQTGIPVEDHRHFTARFEIAQEFMSFGLYRQAYRMLQDLADRARAGGRDDVVAMAELRQMWISHILAARGSPPSRALLAMADSPDQRRSIGAKMLMIRIYSENGDRRDAERLIAELGRNTGRRQLLFSPPYELSNSENAQASNARHEIALRSSRLLTANLEAQMLENFDDKWIDVGYWIRPDGNVEGLEIVRRRNETSWAASLLQSIRGRRYAASDQSTYRLERYTYTSGFNEFDTGTRIARRSTRARIEYFDLSASTAPQPSTTPPPASEPAQQPVR